MADRPKLARPKQNRIIFGTCAALAAYWNADPAYVRFAWVAGTLMLVAFSLGVGFTAVFVYLISPLLIPAEK